MGWGVGGGRGMEGGRGQADCLCEALGWGGVGWGGRERDGGRGQADYV